MGFLIINDVSISFGGPALFEGATLSIEPGERIGLLGRNGSGKSTLLKMIHGDLAPDAGRIIPNGDLKIAMLTQDVPDDLPGTVYDVVASGGIEHLERLKEYHDLTLRVAETHEKELLGKLDRIQHKLESSGAWNFHQQIETVITRTGLDENAVFKTLSAGMKRRVFLARSLVNEPDILLLDEPTNHLDIGSILWLEEFLLSYEHTIMFVTHDREFLRKLSTRIVEIDRGKLMSFSSTYPVYLQRRQAMLEAEDKQRQDFDKKLAQEEVWVRRGVKARRTRNEGRVNALLEMRTQRALRRSQAGNVNLVLQEAQKSGRLVINAEKISFSYWEKSIIGSFSTAVMRGDKVGIIGPNGSGKTTLLKLLLGELQPSQGKISSGTNIRIAYFDQLRAQLDENKTVKDNIAAGNDQVFVNGSPRHIVGFLQDFLFSREQIMSPVKSLSGGERNRLLLARLFSTPSNVLVLDEPTNDLDAETLELLEEKLVQYSGTVLMVSHDRAFLNNVVTSTIVFEGMGRLEEYVGGYDDWLRQRAAQTPAPAPKDQPDKPKSVKPAREKSKLSYKEERELITLPQSIETMEQEKGNLIATLNSPEFQKNNDAKTIISANERLEELDKLLDEAYHRWGELEELSASFST